MTIAVPAALFIWFIIAFLYDGNSWKNLRNTDAGSHPSYRACAAAPYTGGIGKGRKKLSRKIIIQ